MASINVQCCRRSALTDKAPQQLLTPNIYGSDHEPSYLFTEIHWIALPLEISNLLWTISYGCTYWIMNIEQFKQYWIPCQSIARTPKIASGQTTTIFWTLQAYSLSALQAWSADVVMTSHRRLFYKITKQVITKITQSNANTHLLYRSNILHLGDRRYVPALQ